MSRLDEVNRLHGDALARANGSSQVALSILAHQIVELRDHLRAIATADYRGPEPHGRCRARHALADSYGVAASDLDAQAKPVRF